MLALDATMQAAPAACGLVLWKHGSGKFEPSIQTFCANCSAIHFQNRLRWLELRSSGSQSASASARPTLLAAARRAQGRANVSPRDESIPPLTPCAEKQTKIAAVDVRSVGARCQGLAVLAGRRDCQS